MSMNHIVKGNIDQLFPTPVYNSRVLNFDKIQEEIKTAIEGETFVRKWPTHSLTDPTFRESVIVKYNMTHFLEQIGYHLERYTSGGSLEPRYGDNSRSMDEKLAIATQGGRWQREGSCNQWNVYSSWITKFEHRDYGHVHNHGCSDISGVYYYKTNGKDGDLFFQNPNLAMGTTIYQSCMDAHRYPPEAGRLLLFPGWLKHGVHTNETKNIRYSVSFNIDFGKGA